MSKVIPIQGWVNLSGGRGRVEFVEIPGGGGGVVEKESLQILDLQRLASLLMGLNPLACEQALRLGKG